MKVSFAPTNVTRTALSIHEGLCKWDSKIAILVVFLTSK